MRTLKYLFDRSKLSHHQWPSLLFNKYLCICYSLWISDGDISKDVSTALIVKMKSINDKQVLHQRGNPDRGWENHRTRPGMIPWSNLRILHAQETECSPASVLVLSLTIHCLYIKQWGWKIVTLLQGFCAVSTIIYWLQKFQLTSKKGLAYCEIITNFKRLVLSSDVYKHNLWKFLKVFFPDNFNFWCYTRQILVFWISFSWTYRK